MWRWLHLFSTIAGQGLHANCLLPPLYAPNIPCPPWRSLASQMRLPTPPNSPSNASILPCETSLILLCPLCRLQGAAIAALLLISVEAAQAFTAPSALLPSYAAHRSPFASRPVVGAPLGLRQPATSPRASFPRWAWFDPPWCN